MFRQEITMYQHEVKSLYRYKLIIEYDGTSFAGWQAQKNGLAIQTAIENALHLACQEKIRIHGAGRTDAGVHAFGQVAHCDLSKEWDPHRLAMAINFYIRERPIRIIKTIKMDPDFHARFSAKSRCYLYRILNRAAPPGLDINKVWHVPQKLNIELMQEAANLLVGIHDFSTFRAKGCQARSPVRQLISLAIEKQGDEIHFKFHAPSFLYHQVRNFVGTLSMVGQEKWSVQDFKTAFDAKSREKGGPTAPPEGLYFTKVHY
ncbi:MAG: tRNA pseudouridine(38-40) synthase TruA [Alphaproteobacteria bacterium]|nr:tRNA pseudouridine(38-40) synthase TruA [Alphaproteobacteria bacterium]